MKTKRPAFGEKGTTKIAVCNADILPAQAHGECTGALYLWRREGWTIPVDVRDVASVAKKIGIDNLEGDAVDERKATVAARREKRKRDKDGEQTEPQEQTQE
jgi:hypothetical protein